MQWHKKPGLQLVVISLVMVGVLSLQEGFAHNVLNVWGRGEYAQLALSKGSDATIKDERVNVQAQSCADEGAPLGDTYGLTEAEKKNMLNRFPISGEVNPTDYFAYDIFGTNPKDGTKYTPRPLAGGPLDAATTFRQYGNGDARIENALGSMFGYKPTKLKNAYDMVKPAGDVHGAFPGVTVPTNQGACVRAPNPSGSPRYDIGGGYVAMVVFAAADRLTLHIGRHEYIAYRSQEELRTVKCDDGSGPRDCRGGYWIYVRNINVLPSILSAYNSVSAVQRTARADKNPIKLPMVKHGQAIGTARDGNGVDVVIIDSGPIIAANDEFLWKGSIVGGPPPGTNAPPAAQGTRVPGCFILGADVNRWQEGGKAKFNVSVKFSSDGGDGDIKLEKDNQHVAGWNGWRKDTHNPYVYGPEHTGGAIEVATGSVTVKYTGHVANSIACPGVRADMMCTFSADGGCSCGGFACQPFAPPTPLPTDVRPSQSVTPDSSPEPSTQPDRNESPTPPDEVDLPEGWATQVSGTEFIIFVDEDCDTEVCDMLKAITETDLSNRGLLSWTSKADTRRYNEGLKNPEILSLESGGRLKISFVVSGFPGLDGATETILKIPVRSQDNSIEISF